MLFVIVSMLIGSLVIGAQDTTTREAALQWIDLNHHPIATTDPEAELDDLGFLGDLVGRARIVAMGEATHGEPITERPPVRVPG